jgi:hypothetical protein
MSLDVSLLQKVEVFDYNITHNLRKMAHEVGIDSYLWAPEMLKIKKAKQLIKPLRKGLKKLKKNPDFYKQFNPENGWGTYKGLVEFIEFYLDACIEFPKAKIKVSR